MDRITLRIPRVSCTIVFGVALAATLLGAPLVHAARLSPIVFVSDRGGQWDIWVMNGDGSNPVNLTNDKAEDDFAEFSPDGRRIVWTKGGRGPEGEIWVMNADGSGQRQLTFDSFTDFNASWSPDGRQIAWRSRRANNSEIFIMNDDGTNAHQITTDVASDFAPDWSPDGTRIAFTSTRSGHSAIYTMKTDGSDVTKLTPDEMEAALPGWSPDGSRIVFGDAFCATCSESDIFIMNADGSGLVQLTNTPENELAKSWSRDGKSVVGDYARLVPSGRHLAKGDVAAFDVATGAVTKLTDTPGIEEGHPDWSQSGRPTGAVALGDGAEAPVSGGASGELEFSVGARLGLAAGSATIEYALPSAGLVRVRVFDVAGREVARPVDAWQPAGRHTAEFAARGRRQLFFYRVDWQGRRASGKLTLAP